MNLRHLRTFIAIVDAGGVARAAARLHMTQPTASRQVEALETEFGVPLFDRIGRRLRLTSEGEDLLLRGRRLLAEADAMGERGRALKAGDTGLLRIGATPQAIESLLNSVRIPRGKVHAVPLVHRGASIGRWNVTAWDPQRSLAPYAEQFIEELTVYTRRQYPNRDLTRRAPSLPQLHKPVR